MKMEPSARGYNWVTLFLGDINTGNWSSRLGVGSKADDLAVQKKNAVSKSKDMKT
jgi:hypothetical protein